ncbi:hypothetical protein C1645_791814 [Glomus cerebriforme]|uniref:Uncharacterized protein n=1 Tax=Glomus cerebriforme TaxID=658196 RepID=A0A397S9Z4_9GLOM|nr:hypothetical protein C1645_791814 [Glomus cerebriforme]
MGACSCTYIFSYFFLYSKYFANIIDCIKLANQFLLCQSMCVYTSSIFNKKCVLLD